MNIGQKVLVEVEVVQVIADAKGVHYKVALDSKNPFLASMEVTDKDIHFKEVR